MIDQNFIGPEIPGLIFIANSGKTEAEAIKAYSAWFPHIPINEFQALKLYPHYPTLYAIYCPVKYFTLIRFLMNFSKSMVMWTKIYIRLVHDIYIEKRIIYLIPPNCGL